MRIWVKAIPASCRKCAFPSYTRHTLSCTRGITFDFPASLVVWFADAVMRQYLQNSFSSGFPS